MKRFCISLFVAAGALTSAQADLTIVQKTDGASGMNEITTKIKGDMARIEINPQITTIIDSKTGDMKTLMNDKKEIMHISPEKAKAMAEMATRFNKTATGKPKLVPTGRKETINGYEAEEYKIENGLFQASYWITTKYPDYAAILKQLQKMRPATMDVTKAGLPDYTECPGLPIRTNIKIAGQAEITSTIVSIKHDPIPDDQFMIPKDFSEMPMPEFLHPQQPSASPEPNKP